MHINWINLANTLNMKRQTNNEGLACSPEFVNTSLRAATVHWK